MASDGYTPTPWQVQLLGEVADITLGGTPSTEVAGFWGGDIPWMASGEVNKRHIFEVDGRITEAGLAASNATLVDAPAVAVGLAGQGKTRGTAAIVHVRVCTNQSIALIKGKSGRLDTRFLFHNLDSRYEELRSRSAGGGRAGLSREILQKVPVLLPDPCEQSRIALVLDTVDEAIAKTEAVIAKLKQVRAGLLHDLLTRGLDEHGQLRDPIAHPEQFQESPLGRIPREWEVRRLCEVATFQNGKAFPSAEYRETGIRLLRPGNLPSSEFVNWEPGNTTCLPESWVSMANEFLVGGDELVMNLTAQSLEDQFLGRVCMTRSGEHCLLNQRLARFRPFDCHLPFLFWSLRGPSFRPQIDRNPQGTKVQHIYNRDLEAVVLLIPQRRKEQELIASVLFSAANQIESESSQLTKLQDLKSGLMNDLLTGRVRVPESISAGDSQS